MAKTQDENRATARDVSHAYRLLIGREPDPGGCANYVRLVSGARHSAAELAPYLLPSYEFRSRRGARTGTVAVSPDGYTLFVNPGDRDIGASILAQRTYEPHVEAMVREVLQTGDTFIDVGASIGYFTAPAAHPIGTQGHVAPSEPLDKNVRLIYATLWHNPFRNVTVYPFAASSQVGLVAMTSGPSSSNAGIVPCAMGGQRTGMLAQTQRLDDLQAGLKATRPCQVRYRRPRVVCVAGRVGPVVTGPAPRIDRVPSQTHARRHGTRSGRRRRSCRHVPDAWKCCIASGRPSSVPTCSPFCMDGSVPMMASQ